MRRCSNIINLSGECENGSFVPLGFLTARGMGPACTNIFKRIADLITTKRNEQYVQDFKLWTLWEQDFHFLCSQVFSLSCPLGKSFKCTVFNNVFFNLIPPKKVSWNLTWLILILTLLLTIQLHIRLSYKLSQHFSLSVLYCLTKYLCRSF